MSRPLRIEYAGAWYHVMNRGRRKETIFFSDSDCNTFLNICKETCRLFKVDIHAFVLMPNHYHILIRTPLGNISRAMRHINGVYTQKINLKYKLDGGLFRGRFKSILIDEEEYLLELVRYLHRNPFKAGLEQRIGEYEWCSHRGYMNEKYRPKWLEINKVLKSFGKYEKESRKELEAFVNKEVPKDLMKKIENTKWPTILGGKEFKEKVKKILTGKKIREREIPEYKTLVGKKSLNENQINALLLKKKEVFKAKGSRKLSKKRRALVYIIKEKTHKSNREIAEFIGGITDAAISRQYRMAVDEVDRREGCYEDVKRYLKDFNF